MKINIGTFNIGHCEDCTTLTKVADHEMPVLVDKTAKTIKDMGLDVMCLNEKVKTSDHFPVVATIEI